ncbi:MAG: CRISPR-associated endonuclease Cas3'' [Syntrophobacteraceae bacterium]
MPLYARFSGTGKDGQLLSNHLANVAAIAGSFADDFGARDWAGAAGMLHDLGKASQEFQDRLRGSGRKVDHSTAGAQFAANTWKNAGKLLWANK